MSNSVTVKTERYTVEGGGVRVKLALPVLTTDNEAYLKRFDAYYAALREGLTSFAEGALKSSAVKSDGAVYGAAVNTVVCHENSRVLSLYTEAAVTDGQGSRFYRLPQLWDKEAGVLIDPKRLFGRKPVKIAHVLEESLYAKENSGVSVYSDAASILKRRFDIRRMYITPLGLVFFYHGGVLNPRAEPFTLPLGAESAAELLKVGVAEMLWEDQS